MTLRVRRAAFMTLWVFFLLGAAAGAGRAEDLARPSWNPKSAANYLDSRAAWWLKWPSSTRGQGTVCISCHTTLPFALARGALGKHMGETKAGTIETAFIENVKKRVANWDKIAGKRSADKNPFAPFYLGKRVPSALGTESVLNALVLVNHDARRGSGVMSESAEKALSQMWGQQKDDGAWLWLDFGLRPWETEAACYGATLAALAVGTAGKDYYERADHQANIARLKKYLKAQLPNQPLHHRALGLWASARLPGILTDPEKKLLIEQLRLAQEADGGWSLTKLGKSGKAEAWKAHGAFPKGAVSDGYATGLAILALKHSGTAAENSTLRKGIAWLIANERDGTWPATYINVPRNPKDDVGKFMRDAATAFAVLALAD